MRRAPFAAKQRVLPTVNVWPPRVVSPSAGNEEAAVVSQISWHLCAGKKGIGTCLAWMHTHTLSGTIGTHGQMRLQLHISVYQTIIVVDQIIQMSRIDTLHILHTYTVPRIDAVIAAIDALRNRLGRKFVPWSF